MYTCLWAYISPDIAEDEATADARVRLTEGNDTTHIPENKTHCQTCLFLPSTMYHSRIITFFSDLIQLCSGANENTPKNSSKADSKYE